jgi:hypothetical protein
MSSCMSELHACHVACCMSSCTSSCMLHVELHVGMSTCHAMQSQVSRVSYHTKSSHKSSYNSS